MSPRIDARRPARTVGWLAVVVALALALGVTAAAMADDRAESGVGGDVVSMGTVVDLPVNTADPSAPQAGFALDSWTAYPSLEPVDGYSDVIGRTSGAVMVAALRCACPVGEDLLRPRAYAVDRDGRRWESTPVTGDYRELAGLAAPYDMGDPEHTDDGLFRYAEVFVVPSSVADEVRLQLDQFDAEPVIFDR